MKDWIGVERGEEREEVGSGVDGGDRRMICRLVYMVKCSS